MIPSKRKEVSTLLRLVAKTWYEDEPRSLARWYVKGKCTYPFFAGVCYAASVLSPNRSMSAVYKDIADALKLVAEEFTARPFSEEAGGHNGDWTVRPMFCLLLADALEQME